jgi:hypothetical protein
MVAVHHPGGDSQMVAVHHPGYTLMVDEGFPTTMESSLTTFRKALYKSSHS